MIHIPIGKGFEIIVNWLTANFQPFFHAISTTVTVTISGIEQVLLFPPSWLMIIILTALAYFIASKGVALFTLIGMFLIDSMALWQSTMETLALVITSALIALIIGIPLGIWSSKSDNAERIIRPILDFMQTMPAFVYLIPAVLFFQLGEVPGVMATLIFSMPPAVRLTNLGIRQVPMEVKEAAQSFGSTSKQMLFKVELPIAIPTILAGVNQTIMLALSMVVISAMIGAGGLGEQVLKGITQLKIGLGFESGIAVVILAIFLDRITQSLGLSSQNRKSS
ncbi:MAG TPA: proline/glycine betaine ABC transporter permease [Balneolales bacterium]|nr:proline/glycine betaine ABC transporter permease [Balneolales bacterium]